MYFENLLIYFHNPFHLFPQPVMKESFKSHIFLFWNQKLWVENPELLNLHKRLSIQPLVIAHGTPILPIVNTYILLVLRWILQEWGFYLEGVRLWRTTVSYSQEMMWVTFRWASLYPDAFNIILLFHLFLFQSIAKNQDSLLEQATPKCRDIRNCDVC